MYSFGLEFSEQKRKQRHELFTTKLDQERQAQQQVPILEQDSHSQAGRQTDVPNSSSVFLH